MARPLSTFHGFAGQRMITDALRQHCRGALTKKKALPHISLSGPSGYGKTRLAKAVATEMQTKCLSFYSSRQSTKYDLASLLSKVSQADIVFIDEVHSLPHECQEMLYPAIDELRVPASDDSRHRVVENEWQELPDFTIIVASDQYGLLTNALRQRLVLDFTLTDYGIEELVEITRNCASDLGLLLKSQAARRFAEAARGQPRKCHQLLQSFHTAVENTDEEVSKPMVDRYLASLGIDAQSLKGNDRKYLKSLMQRQTHMSLDNLATIVGIDKVAVQRDIESYMIKQGLIGIDRRGRILTPAGVEFVNLHGENGNGS